MYWLKMFNQYKGVASIFKDYWVAYGGLEKLTGSPYLHAAVMLLILTVQTWSGYWRSGSSDMSGWWDQSISVLPNLLGFTLGGFAIFIGFGDEKFRALLAQPAHDSIVNDYVALCAHFVHFIVVQALALLTAIVAKSLYFYTPIVDPIRDWLPWINAIFGAFGYGLFLYALTSVLAATMHVFRIARLYARFQES
jgi:hypothetical protein